MTSTDELERLIKSASELPWKEGLRAGDEKDVWGPGYLVAKVYLGSPAAKRRANNAALIVAAVNALPELLERVKRLEADLQVIAFGWRYVAEPDNSFTKVDWTRDQLIEYARTALKETGQ